MSNTLPPLSALRMHQEKVQAHADLVLPSIASWSGGYRDLQPFSSPPPSSSPPTTPFSNRHYTYIRSSPRLHADIGLPGRTDHSDDLSSSWDRHYTPAPAFKQSDKLYALPSFHSTFPSDDDFPITSEFDASETSEDVDVDLHYARSDDVSESLPGQSSIFDSDEEEVEGNDDDEGFSFKETHLRATFFRTSAERGRWRSDPVPFKPSSFLQMRQSVPSSSPGPSGAPQLSQRRISEPALSTTCPASTSTLTAPCDESDVPLKAICATSNAISPEVDPSDSLPLLSTDRESSMEDDEVLTPLSPLPPSSPPLSPLSSPMRQSMSPLSFAPSSPLLAPSSPLSILSSLDEDEDLILDDPAKQEDRICSLPSASEGEDPRVSPVENPTPSKPGLASSPNPISFSVPEPEVCGTLTSEGGEVVVQAEVLQGSDHIRGSPVAEELVPSPRSLDVLPENSSTSELSPSSAPSIARFTDDVAAASTPNTESLAESTVDVAMEVDDVPVISTSPVQMMAPFPETSRGLDSPHLQPLTSLEVARASSNPSRQQSEARSVTPFQPGTIQKGKGKQEDKDDKALKVKDSNVKVSAEGSKKVLVEASKRVVAPPTKSSKDKDKEKRKQAEQDEAPEGPVKKKRRTSISAEDPSASISTSNTNDLTKSVTMDKGEKVEKSIVDGSVNAKSSSKDEEKVSKAGAAGKAKADKKRRLEEEESSLSDSTPGPSTKKQKKSDIPATRPSKKQSKARRSAESGPSSAPPPPPASPETAAIDAEACGMLIESLALSRASSIPASSLFKTVLLSHPGLKDQRSEQEWTQIFERVLLAGEGGVFGKVESSGKDDSERPLEARWFYVPELDHDQERATLIRSMMPRPGKRSVTKKYKQYYWRPLDKISRWDPEDDL